MINGATKVMLRLLEQIYNWLLERLIKLIMRQINATIIINNYP